jgi:hypothetical protein
MGKKGKIGKLFLDEMMRIKVNKSIKFKYLVEKSTREAALEKSSGVGSFCIIEYEIDVD